MSDPSVSAPDVGNCTTIRPSSMPSSLSGTVSNVHKHYNHFSLNKGHTYTCQKLVIPVLLVSFSNNTYTIISYVTGSRDPRQRYPLSCINKRKGIPASRLIYQLNHSYQPYSIFQHRLYHLPPVLQEIN